MALVDVKPTSTSITSNGHKTSENLLGSHSKSRIAAEDRACESPAAKVLLDDAAAGPEETGEGSPAGQDFRPWTHWIYVNGRIHVVSTGIMVNSEPPYYLPVIDKDGFLLGEFSQLDDLSITDMDF